MDRVTRLQDVLKSRFDFELSDVSEDALLGLYEEIQQQKYDILHESHFNSYYEHKDYSQLLLTEALVSMILREIAPKRIHRKRTRK